VHLVRRGGLVSRDIFYFNYLLFVPIWSARRLIKLLAIRVDSENQINGPLLNRLLTGIFMFDVATARILRPPFGVSIMLVATRSA